MTEYKINNKTLAEHGVESASLTYTNQAADELVWRVPTKSGSAGDAFGYGSTVRLSGGGATYFTGRVTGVSRSASPAGQASTYTAKGPWAELMRLPYSQPMESFEGNPDSIPSREHPAVVIGRNADGERVDTMQTLRSLVDYAAGHGVPIAVGSLVPGLMVPEWETHSRSVGDIVRQILAWHPDCVAWINYAAGTPKLSVTNRDSAAQETIDADSGRPVAGLDTILRRDDMVPTNVVISWETTQNEITHDVDPRTGIDHPDETKRVRLYQESVPHADILPGTLFFTLPASGGSSPWQVNNYVQPVVTRPIPVPGDKKHLDEDKRWWIDHSGLAEFAELIGEDNIHLPHTAADGVEPHKVTLLPARDLVEIPPATNPASVPLAKPLVPKLEDYPNELVEGAITDWMRIKKNIVDIEAVASVSLGIEAAAVTALSEEDRRQIEKMEKKEVELGGVNYKIFELRHRFIATNARTKIYRTPASIEAGDPGAWTEPDGGYNPDDDPLVVRGLAEAVYQSRVPAQWQGSVSLSSRDAPRRFMGRSVNIRREGRPEWRGMRGLVQSERLDLLSGGQTITFGPAGHLGVQDFSTLLQPARDMQRAAAGGGASGAAEQQQNPVFGAQRTARSDTVGGGAEVSANGRWDLVSAPGGEEGHVLRAPLLVAGLTAILPGVTITNDPVTLAAGKWVVLECDDVTADPLAFTLAMRAEVNGEFEPYEFGEVNGRQALKEAWLPLWRLEAVASPMSVTLGEDLHGTCYVGPGPLALVSHLVGVPGKPEVRFAPRLIPL